MEPRSGLRHYTRGSVRPPLDHYQHDLSGAESSDEDDDDIPASKLPSVSPSKRPSSSSNQAKRSLSDVAQGGIVLYPGSKRQRNGYNMFPALREPLQNSTLNSSRTPIAAGQTPSRTESLSPSPEDDVFEGLVESVNGAIRRQETQYYLEQRLYQEVAPTSPPFKEVTSGELEGDGYCIGNNSSGLPLAIPDGTNGRLRQNASTEPIPTNATVNRENEAEKDVRLRVDNVSASLRLGDVWDIPNSPGQLSAQEEPADSSSQMPQPMKEKERLPQLPKAPERADLLPNEIPYTEKRKRGRPRKNYPRLSNETDSDYIMRIARLRNMPIRGVLGPDALLHRQLSPALIATSTVQSIAANQPGPVNQGDDSHILTQSQRLDPPPQSCIQPKVEPEEDAAQCINHAEPVVGEAGNQRNGDFSRHDDDLAQYEAIEADDNQNIDPGANEDGNLSEFIDGFETDSGSGSIVDPSEESFKHDVDAFNARQTRHVGVEDFEGPADDDVLAVRLDYQPLGQLCKLLSDVSWAGVKGNWQWRDFDYDDAETKPARALLPVLAKLERFYQACPKAPDLEEQNQFLREHADMLRYYFHKITIVVDHIRTCRLEIPEHNEATYNANSRKRKRMSRDLVLYIIPMLAHVFASTWGLGGKRWLKASFTSTAVELLKRALGWIMVLHPRLLEELKRCSLEENPGKPEGHRLQQAWQRRNVKREEIGPLLDNLYQVIAAAPDQLAEAEIHAREELQQREQQLRQEKLDDEARQALVAERKKRSLLSIHGIHYRLESSATSSRRPSSRSSRSAEWSVEEQRILFLRIQASFPVCPDLKDLCFELNKTVAQTLAMTEDILRKMLAKVLVGYSPEEQAAELRRIMHTS
ncbi:hypothetical protein GGS24DRAFT_450171 [Hypoxylon argillaceum]|nr:hypothetical protein GGS24DRAFT_450171 [Hypoxylon argillaceum]